MKKTIKCDICGEEIPLKNFDKHYELCKWWRSSD
jgi:hypothetical protein